MENYLVSWLYSLVLGACITTLLIYISPMDSKTSFLKIGCSGIMFLLFISPLIELSNGKLEIPKDIISVNEIQFENTSEELMKKLIEEYSVEYITNEAEAFELSFDSVDVLAQKDDSGNYILSEIMIYTTQSIPQEFQEHITNALGVPLTINEEQINETDD